MTKLTDWLGYEVTHTITGVKGVVTSVVTTWTGMEQLEIQPKGTGKDVPSGYYFDPPQCKKGKLVAPPAKLEVPEFNLKDEVIDLASDFKGVIIEKIQYLNGCIKYQLCSKIKNTKEIDTGYTIYVMQGRLKLIKAHVEEKKEPVKRTGGPIRPAIPVR